MNRVILTGASGFIGKHCLPHLLEAGFEVHAIFQKKKPEDIGNQSALHWHQVDLLDVTSTAAFLKRLNASHLLHLAWYAEPGKFWTSELNKNWLEASKKLFTNFAEAGGRRIVGAGTGAEYDWADGILKEDSSAINASTYYGQCKAELYKYGTELAKAQKIEFAWGRIFWLYGPGEDERRLVPYVINSLLRNEEARCSDGTQKRDFMHVNDVARAFAVLLKSGISGAINIGSGEAVSIKSIVDTLAEELNKINLLKLGSITSNSNEPAVVVADSARLQEELGFRPSISLEQGLKETIDWWISKRRETNTSD